MEVIKIALNALRVNKLRSGLTMLGVVIGVSSVVTLLAIGSGLKKYVNQQFEALGSNLIIVFPGQFTNQGTSYSFTQEAAFFDFKFTDAQVSKIKKTVKKQNGVAPLIRKTAKIRYKKEEKTVLVAGTTKEYSQLRNLQFEAGHFFSNSEERGGKKIIVLGGQIAEELFKKTNPLGKKVNLGSYRFKVIGVVKKKGQGGGLGFNVDEFVYIPRQTAKQIFDLDKYNAILTQASSKKDIEEVKREVKEILLASLDEDEFTVTDQKELLLVIENILNVFSAALGGIAAISLVVGGIGIANMMLVSVTERTREIGLRKAVGATKENILSQFLTEAVILSLSGGALGIIFGSGFSLLLNRFFKTSITAWSVILAFGVSALVGIISGVGPAAKAARQNPIEALRYE